MTLADQINHRLRNNGIVQVMTHTKSTTYTAKHAGWFEMIKGSLYVRHGRRKNRLSHGDHVLVGIRFGMMVRS